MGLGKTPTTIARLLAAAGAGPSLVIAPAAVVANWAAEAAHFAPALRVAVHHGANRAAVDEIAAVAAHADIVITTYATAVRDVDALAEVEWSHLVLDEAQAIKNPTSETAQPADPRTHAGRADGNSHRERPRRSLGDPRLHQSRPRRPACAVHRAALGRR